MDGVEFLRNGVVSEQPRQLERIMLDTET